MREKTVRCQNPEEVVCLQDDACQTEWTRARLQWLLWTDYWYLMYGVDTTFPTDIPESWCDVFTKYRLTHVVVEKFLLTAIQKLRFSIRGLYCHWSCQLDFNKNLLHDHIGHPVVKCFLCVPCDTIKENERQCWVTKLLVDRQTPHSLHSWHPLLHNHSSFPKGSMHNDRRRRTGGKHENQSNSYWWETVLRGLKEFLNRTQERLWRGAHPASPKRTLLATQLPYLRRRGK